MKIAVAQMAPVFLNRKKTVAKLCEWIERAAKKGCELVVFSETILPGYPVWLDRTDGARFNDDDQKEMFAHYLDQAVDLLSDDFQPIRKAAKTGQINVILGVAERAQDRAGHTIYCSCVVVGKSGEILSNHRKLMPTYEERLVWGTGDGNGLVVHQIGEFTVGALNCWENWMPLARTALHAQGENLHVSLWPGNPRNTTDITRFMALEGRSFVVAANGILRGKDIPQSTPMRERFVSSDDEMLMRGGSAIASPDGQFLVAPIADREELLIEDLNLAHVREERQNFDLSGHYARPDVLKLQVDRRRHGAVDFLDDELPS
ncbi:MAG: nitrilase [Planctomycetota bacterium]|jgi:nitrilase